MCTIKSKLTVLFDEPFWIGLYEREYDGQYEVCKITFGAEPKDYEIFDFLLRHGWELSFSPTLAAAKTSEKRLNPKRRQRDIKRQMQNSGIGTKAQQALKQQQEQGKLARRTRGKEEREAEAERQYQMRQEKRKEKHRGH